MICPYCNIGIHEQLNYHWVNGDNFEHEGKFYGYQFAYMLCPQCNKLIVYLIEGNAKYQADFGKDCRWFTNTEQTVRTLINPKFSTVVVDPLVPQKYANEFIEAANTIQTSAKASATLSRRLLQMVLRDEMQIKKTTYNKRLKNMKKEA